MEAALQGAGTGVHAGARARRAELRAALEAGRDPAAERRAERASRSNMFEAVAREWLAKQPFAAKTLQVVRYAIATGRAERDPTGICAAPWRPPELQIARLLPSHLTRPKWAGGRRPVPVVG